MVNMVPVFTILCVWLIEYNFASRYMWQQTLWSFSDNVSKCLRKLAIVACISTWLCSVGCWKNSCKQTENKVSEMTLRQTNWWWMEVLSKTIWLKPTQCLNFRSELDLDFLIFQNYLKKHSFTQWFLSHHQLTDGLLGSLDMLVNAKKNPNKVCFSKVWPWIAPTGNLAGSQTLDDTRI